MSWCPPFIEADLQRVEDVLRERVASRASVIPVVYRYMVEAGGKRLRPALVLLGARCVGEVNDRTTDIAVAAETIHLASMMHDDVVDQADLRRGQSSVNVRWSNQVSVLVGDYLIGQLYRDLARAEERFALAEFTHTVVRMCEGELSHMEFGKSPDDGERVYLQIVADKTGSLMRACCRVGAHTAGALPEQIDALGEYGQALGTAFQIVDDLLDVVADQDEVGKPVRNDVEMRRPTLPVLHTLSHGDERTVAELRGALRASEPGAAQRAADLAKTAGGVAYAAARARTLAHEARRALSSLTASPAAEALAELSHYVVDRAPQ